jgi:Tol biopolymer transport system component
VDGSGIRQLTDGVYRDRAPRWSPDGSTLSFYSNRTGTYEIWTVRPDGSRLQQVTFGGPTVTFFFPVWSPDGQRIAFGDLKNRISYVYELATPWADQQPRRLPAAPQADTFFAPWSWSAVGGLAGWAFREDGQSAGVLVYETAANRYRQVSTTGSRPAWLPDGRHLLVEERNALSIVDTASGDARRLDLPAAVDDEFSLSPDGSSIYFMQSERQGDIWLITLDGARRPKQ